MSRLTLLINRAIANVDNGLSPCVKKENIRTTCEGISGLNLWLSLGCSSCPMDTKEDLLDLEKKLCLD